MSRDTELALMMTVKDGYLSMTPTQRQMIVAFLSRTKLVDVTVKISKPRKIRSLTANKYYWGVVLAAIGHHVGHTPEEIHYVLKDQFLPRKFIKLGAKEIEIRKSTADLSTGEFNLYLTQIAAWAAQELGLELPSSNQM